MITIHYDFVDGTEISFAEGRSTLHDFTTNCIAFFSFDRGDVKVVRRDGYYLSTTEILLNDGRYGNKHFRIAHNLQKMLVAGAFDAYWQKPGEN